MVEGRCSRRTCWSPVRRLGSAGAVIAASLAVSLTGLVAIAPPVSAGPLFIANSSFADDHDYMPGDGVCASAFNGCTLRAAIEEARTWPDATISIPAGYYELSLGEQLVLDTKTRNLTIVGAGSGRTIISGGGWTRVFDIAAGATVTIDGVTIQHGVVTSKGFADHFHGAGIHNHGTLILRNSTLWSNSVPASHPGSWGGGGITNASTGDATLINVTLLANSAESGEGAGIENLGIMRLTHVTVATQLSRTGRAAVYNAGGASLSAENSIFDHAIWSWLTGARNCRGVVTSWFSISDDMSCNLGLGYDGIDSHISTWEPMRHVLPLPVNSPALDSAVNAGIGSDQVGNPRPADGDCNGSVAEDLGAVEYQPYYYFGSRGPFPGCRPRRFIVYEQPPPFFEAL